MYNNKYLIGYLENRIKELNDKKSNYSKGKLSANKNILNLINSGIV